MKFYVYVDLTIDGKVFYVGKGSGRRAFEFRRNSKHRRISKKFGRVRKILFYTDVEAIAFKHEAALITYFGTFTTSWTKGIECNFTFGGDGASGAIRSKKTREKIRRNNERTKISRKLKCSQNNAMKRPEVVAKVSKSLTGVPKSPIHRKNLSKSKQGCPPTRGTTGMIFDQETRLRMSLSQKQIAKSKSHKEKIAIALRYWNLKKKFLKILRSPSVFLFRRQRRK